MIMRDGEPEQADALTRAFLARFFENEITAGTDDLKTTFFWLLSFLAVPGFFMPMAMGLTWQLVALVHGPEALRVLARGDKAFYLGFAMIASGAISTIAWNSLLVDRRDGLILGALPVRPAVIVASRLAAIMIYVTVAVTAMHLLASVSWGLFLGSHNTIVFVLRGMLAHFIASCASGACVMVWVTGAQGLALACVGPRVFARVSPVMQVALVCFIVAGLLALPVINVSVVDTLNGSGSNVRPWILWAPPLWFLGLYEWVLGTSDPVLIALARKAVFAVLAGAAGTIVSYPIASRRIMTSAVQSSAAAAGDPVVRRIGRLVTRATGRAAGIRAVSQFLLATMGRVERCRFVLAAAVGIAVAWVLPGALSIVGAGSQGPRADILSLSLSSILFLVAGARIALSLPADHRAAWLFEASPPDRGHARAAMERTLLALVVLPITLVSAPLYWILWGETRDLHPLAGVALDRAAARRARTPAFRGHAVRAPLEP